MDINKTRPLPHQYKTIVLHASIIAWCLKNGYSGPVPHRIVRSILPRLTEPDLNAIENDRHPLWVSNKDLKKMLRTIYTMQSDSDKVVADILDQCGKKKDIREVNWDDVIAPRRFSPEQLEKAIDGVTPVLDSAGVISEYLATVHLEDMVNIQKFTSYLWTYLGNPEKITVNEERIGNVYVAEYNFGSVMSSHIDLLIGDQTAFGSPVDLLIELMKDQLRSIIPNWDTLEITRADSEDGEFVGIRVEIIFATADIPLLMTNLYRHVYCEPAYVN